MQMPIPEDWNGEDYCRWAVCWPNSSKWKAILFGLLAQPSQGRFWDADTGYIKGIQADFQPFYDANFNLSEVIMACNDTGIAEALEAIALAISNQQNCADTSIIIQSGGSTSNCYSSSNSGVTTIITLEDDTQLPIYGDQPIITLPESGFPEGYPDLETYDVDKCRKATKLANDFITSLNNMGTVTWVTSALGTGVLGGALVGLIVLPAALIPVMLFALIGAIGINAFIIALANACEENKDELICIFYQGDTMSEIWAALNVFFVGLVAVIDPPAGIAAVLVDVALWMLGSDTLGVLFSAQAAEAYPDADCSCGDGCFQGDYDFVDDLQGWGLAEELCGSAQYGTPSIAHYSGSPHAGMHLEAVGGYPPQNRIVVQGPPIEDCHTIQSNSRLDVDIVVHNGGGVTVRTNGVLSESGCTEFCTNNGVSSYPDVLTITCDVGGYAGQIMSSIVLEIANSVGNDVNVVITGIRFYNEI